MLPETPPELPDELGGLAALAARAYVRRWPLYLGIAAIVYGVDVLLLLTRPNDGWTNVVGSSLAEAFLVAVVSIGVLADGAGVAASTRAILARATSRWWAVSIVNVLFNLLVSSTVASGVLSLSPDNGYGVVTILYIALWAAVALATVVAAADTRVPGRWLVIFALNRGGALAFTPANLLRTSVIALTVLIFVALQLAATTALVRRGLAIPLADAYGALVVNAVLLGPIQAVVAAFSLDMARRITPPPRA